MVPVSLASAAELFGSIGPWALLVVAYLLGSVPFGLILARLVKGVDLRTIGSGNIGATNAVRAMGRRWGFAVFALDFAKGWAPVFLAPHVIDCAPGERGTLQVLAGTAAVLGHCFPLYLRFRGGKGVATGCGAIVAMEPFVFVSGGLVWLVTRFSTGYAGLASILMGLTFPVAAWFLGGEERTELVVGGALLALLIVLRHRSNIQRMLAGTEPRAGAAKPHG